MRNAKFWIAGLALLLGTTACAQTPPTAPPTPAQVIAEITQALTDAGTDPTVAGLIAPVLQMALARAQVQTTLDNSTAQRVTDLDTKESSDVASLNAAIAALSGGGAGPAGPAATVAVGTVTAAPAGTAPAVTNSGTSSAAVLNFVIPAGAPGANGAPGADGASLAPQTLPSPYTYQFHMNSGGVTSNETFSTNSGVLFISGPAVGAKSFADYLIPVFQAGNYKVKFRMWVSTGSTPVKFHLECPVGTTVATFNYVPPGSSPNYVQTGDNNDVGTKLPFALPQGLQDMRLVIDSAAVGPSINWFDWMALTKQ